MPWTWSSGAPANAWRDLRVFTVLPNWKNGVLESLSWETDVMSSEIGAEQRRGSRRYPRRQFEASFLRAGSNRARIDNYLSALGREIGLVPLWHEQYKLGAASVDGSVTFDSGSLAYREFRLGDLVMVTAGDPNVYDVLQVTAHNTMTDTIMLQGITSVGPWPEKSKIIPLRRARLMDAPKLSNHTDRVGTAQLRFTLQDVDTQFIASWGYCAPLWRFKPDRQQAMDIDYMRSDFTLDFGSGVIDTLDPSNRAQILQSMSVKLFNRAQVHAFRSFLYMARGRAVRFYVPTFAQDIIPLGDMSGDTFDGRINGFSEYHEVPQEARRIAGVVFKDGRPTIYRNIVSVAPILSPTSPFRQVGERFTIDQEMPPILESEVDRIMFVAPSRFDQDTIEIAHVVSGSHAASSAVVTRSAIVAGMPPIECWVTSRPYPIEAVDNMTTTAAVLMGRFGPSVDHFDSLTTDADVTAGTLNVALLGYIDDVIDENITTDADVTAGTLVSPLVGYIDDTIDENITTDADVTAGTLQVVLIDVVDDVIDENIRTTAAIIEGTLT